MRGQERALRGVRADEPAALFQRASSPLPNCWVHGTLSDPDADDLLWGANSVNDAASTSLRTRCWSCANGTVARHNLLGHWQC